MVLLPGEPQPCAEQTLDLICGEGEETTRQEDELDSC